MLLDSGPFYVVPQRKRCVSNLSHSLWSRSFFNLFPSPFFCVTNFNAVYLESNSRLTGALYRCITLGAQLFSSLTALWSSCLLAVVLWLLLMLVSLSEVYFFFTSLSIDTSWRLVCVCACVCDFLSFLVFHFEANAEALSCFQYPSFCSTTNCQSKIW